MAIVMVAVMMMMMIILIMIMINCVQCDDDNFDNRVTGGISKFISMCSNHVDTSSILTLSSREVLSYYTLCSLSLSTV